MKRVALFCGAATGTDQALVNEVMRFVELLAGNKVEIIYGGGKLGMMGIVADTAIRCQAKIIGIMPQRLIDKEIAHDALSELISVDSLSQRKQLISLEVDSFVLLPGGVGSLDEFFDALSQAQIGVFKKKFGILNAKNYYDHLLVQLNKGVEFAFMSKVTYDAIQVETTAQSLFTAMSEGVVPDINRYAKDNLISTFPENTNSVAKTQYAIQQKVTLKGKYSLVSPFDFEQHAPSLYRAFSLSSDDNWMYLPYGPFASEKQFLNWAKVTCTGNDPLFFSIHAVNCSNAIGMMSLVNVSQENRCVEMGHVHFSAALQKTKEATEAVFLLMQYVFETLGYRRLEWKCDNANEGSKRSALRFGFMFEGLFRQHRIYKSRNRDTAWYSIIDKEWPVLKQRYETWLSSNNFDEKGKRKAH